MYNPIDPSVRSSFDATRTTYELRATSYDCDVTWTCFTLTFLSFVTATGDRRHTADAARHAQTLRDAWRDGPDALVASPLSYIYRRQDTRGNTTGTRLRHSTTRGRRDTRRSSAGQYHGRTGAPSGLVQLRDASASRSHRSQAPTSTSACVAHPSPPAASSVAQVLPDPPAAHQHTCPSTTSLPHLGTPIVVVNKHAHAHTRTHTHPLKSVPSHPTWWRPCAPSLWPAYGMQSGKMTLRSRQRARTRKHA